MYIHGGITPPNIRFHCGLNFLSNLWKNLSGIFNTVGSEDTKLLENGTFQSVLTMKKWIFNIFESAKHQF